MTFIIWTWPVSHQDVADVPTWTSYVKAFESYHITDIQTDTTKYYGRFAGGNFPTVAGIFAVVYNAAAFQ